MVKLNRPQREALARVYRRMVGDALSNGQSPGKAVRVYVPSYLSLRRKVEPGPGCVMVPYAGMWLGIEPDGYTHS